MAAPIDGTRGLCEDVDGVHMLIIDPQVDFHHGSLAVKGAPEDVKRYSDLILNNIQDICKVHVTLDTHHKQHIAHAVFWQDENGDPPAPFTLIKPKDVENGVWETKRPELREHSLAYTKTLEKDGRFTLCIWPEHCIIGTPGHNVMPTLQHALTRWSTAHMDMINFVFKGQNPLSESYSALRADYRIETDPTTHINKDLIDRLLQSSRVLICGEAKSHCVNFTVRDLIQHWPKNRLKDLWILEDGMSSVTGFEKEGDKFIEDMRKEGLTICKCADAFDY